MLAQELNKLGYLLIHINQYNTHKQSLEIKLDNKKILDVCDFVTAIVLNTKIGEVENKIPGTSGLETNSVLKTIFGEVENKVSDASYLVKKTDYNIKNSDLEKNYF